MIHNETFYISFDIIVNKDKDKDKDLIIILIMLICNQVSQSILNDNTCILRFCEK